MTTMMWSMAVVTTNAIYAQSGIGESPVPVASHESIEMKALLLKPGDPSSVTALADELLSFPRAYPRMPAALEGTVESRLVQAEISYSQGGPGVEEQDVVRAFNMLAERFGAPAYAKTSVGQVRVVRMSLALSEPKFMGTGVARQNVPTGESISSTLSPLQSVHLLATLVDQKFLNPDFQVLPADWDRIYYQAYLSRLEARQQRQQLGQSQPVPKRFRGLIRENPKQSEIHDALSRGLSSLSWRDALNVIDETFAILRIGQ